MDVGIAKMKGQRGASVVRLGETRPLSLWIRYDHNLCEEMKVIDTRVVDEIESWREGSSLVRVAGSMVTLLRGERRTGKGGSARRVRHQLLWP